MDVVHCYGLTEWDGASSTLVNQVRTYLKEMARVGLSDGMPWHEVVGLVLDHHSTCMTKMELESGWTC